MEMHLSEEDHQHTERQVVTDRSHPQLPCHTQIVYLVPLRVARLLCKATINHPRHIHTINEMLTFLSRECRNTDQVNWFSLLGYVLRKIEAEESQDLWPL